MKTLKYLLFIYLLGASFTFVSCTKESSYAPAPDPEKKAYLACNIDGTPFTATAKAVVQPRFMNINGVLPNGQTIDMYLEGTTAAYYEIGHGSTNTAALGPNNGTNPASGYVAVTSFDREKKLISGSFNFTVTLPNDNTQKKVTNGTFTNVPF